MVCCYEDKKGNLWFGTARGGLYCYDGKSFKLFTTKDGLIDNNIGCIYEDKAGNIWIGTEHGASRFDGKAFTNFTGNNGFSDNTVNCIIEDKSGNVLLGTTDGLFVFDGSSFTKKPGVPFERITALLADRKGNLWIGSFDGFCRYDDNTFTHFLSNHLTYYIAEDRAGNILLTHSEQNTQFANIPNQVLYRYDGKAFTKIIEKDKPNDFQIFGKTVDRDGNLWFGTMHGPCRYDGKSFTYFTK